MPVSFPNRYGAVARSTVSPAKLSHGFGAGMGRAQPMPQDHSHGDLELNFVYSGQVRYAVGGHELAVPEGTLCAFWAAIPHRVVALAPHTRFMWLNVPLTVLLRWNLDASFMGRVLAGELISDLSKRAGDTDLTRRWLRDLGTQESDLIRTVEIEVEARIRRLAQQSLAVKGEDGWRSQVAVMTAYLVAHFREGISAADVANAVGLNRHYAMRLFKRGSGLSIWQYLLRLRVSHAQQMLLTTDVPLVAVGLDSGFASLSRFYDTFTRECKMPPAEYRRRAGSSKLQAVGA